MPVQRNAVASQGIRKILTPRIAAGLLVMATVAWGIVLTIQHRSASVKRHIEAGIEFARQGQGKAAEREWLAAVKVDPNHRNAWELLGELYFSIRAWPNAVHAFQNLLRLDPNAPAIHSRLAASLMCAGDERAAYKHAQEELKRNPDDIAALGISVYVLSFMGEEQRLLKYLRRLAALQPDDIEFLGMLAEMLTAKHHYAEARSVLDRILQLEPESAQAYAMRGVGWFNEDPSPRGLAAAEADLLRALRLNPLSPYARFCLGRLYKRQGKADKAIFQLEEAARMTPDKIDVFYELAGAYELAGNNKMAGLARKRFQQLRREADLESRLEKRCAANPDNFDLHLQMGLLTFKKGDARKAGYYLHRAVTLRPNDPRANEAFAKFEERMGRSSARAIQEKVAASSSSPQTGARSAGGPQTP